MCKILQHLLCQIHDGEGYWGHMLPVFPANSFPIFPISLFILRKMVNNGLGHLFWFGCHRPCWKWHWWMKHLQCCGLLTYKETETDTVSSPSGNPPDCTRVVLCRMFTLQKDGDRSLSLNDYCSHFSDRAPSMDRGSIYVNEYLLMLTTSSSFMTRSHQTPEQLDNLGFQVFVL